MPLKQYIPAIKYGWKLSSDEQEGFLGYPFSVSQLITTATGSATHTLITDAQVALVGSSAKAYITYVTFINTGNVAWNTTNVGVYDSDGTTFLTMGTGSCIALAWWDSSGTLVTQSAPFYAGTGGGVGKGIYVKGNFDGTGSAGYITVCGLIK